MKRATILVLGLVGVILWVACESPGTTEPLETNPSFAISDANNGGTSNFYWLPPLVAPADYSGTFIATLSPEVRICDWTIQDPSDGEFPGCGSQDWTFFRTDGPAGHRVGVDVNGQHYHLNWDTEAEEITAKSDTRYRVSVILGGIQIGFIDIHFGATGKEAKNLKTEDIVPLNDGRTLPIKFRIGNEMFDVMFQSNKDGGEDPLDFDIFLMDSESGAMGNITQHPALDATANWHPDGDLIVFASDRADRGQHPDLYTMNPDGTGVQLLMEDGWQPEYSPDGTKVVFQRGWPPQPEWPGSGCTGPDTDPCGREHDIWIMDADGTNQIQLTDVPYPVAPEDDPENPWNWIDLYEDWSPTWDPTGNWVTFGRSRNGSNYPRPVPPWLDCDEYKKPDWGTWEWFWDNPRAYCHFDVVSIDVSDTYTEDPISFWADRPRIRHTFDLDVDQLGPKWSPAGVLTFKEHTTDGYIVALPAGLPADFSAWPTTPRRPLTYPNQSGDISWSPNGPWVLFSSERSGDIGIYSVANWGDWLATGNAYPQEPFVVIPGKRADWARFRPF